MQFPKLLRLNLALVLALFSGLTTMAQKTESIRIIPQPASQRVDVFIGKELFTSLLYADSLKKPILFPINAAGNNSVTRGWPLAPKEGDQIDHPHQIGSWLNFGDVNGADYWNNSTSIDSNAKAYGTIRFDKLVSRSNGKGKAELVTRSVWYNPKGRAMLEEITRYIFRTEGNERIIDRSTTLKAIEDVLFKDNKEGFFAIRVARELEHPGTKPVKVYSKDGVKSVLTKENLTGRYENSNGIAGEAVFGTRSNWLKLSGFVNNKPVAVAIIDHPENAGFPGYWMARGYGLFAINPLGAEFYTNGKEKLNFVLKKDGQTNFNHRLVIAQQLSNRRLDELFNSFKLSK